MKITLLQTDIIWGQPEANLAHLDHLLEGLGECDLIVLPEMFTTGFDTNPETVADDEGIGPQMDAQHRAPAQLCLGGQRGHEGGRELLQPHVFRQSRPPVGFL